MLTIIKNDWYRMKEQRMYLYVALGLTIFAAILAVVLSSKLHPKMNLAVVLTGEQYKSAVSATAPHKGRLDLNPSGSSTVPTGIAGVNVTLLKKSPAPSALIQGRYDAVLTYGADGSRKITTVKSKKLVKQLTAALDGKGEAAAGGEGRQIGTNIIGYMLMFLLMQGVLYARLFAEDKEKHQMERIVCSPIPFWQYLAGHVVFMWILICAPAMLVIGVMKLVGVSVGFSLWQYLLLIGLEALVSASFALCLNSFFCTVDTANMAGSCAVVLTSVLSGSFYDLGGNGGVIGRLLYLFPQKDLMLFSNAWEKHILNKSAILSLFYVIICAVLFLIVGVAKTRKDYVYHGSMRHGKG